MPNINPDKFPKGYIFKGSNGESFVIIVDSRGKNRWQKITEKPNQSYLNKVKESISLMNETIDGDPNEAIELKEILDKKINYFSNKSTEGTALLTFIISFAQILHYLFFIP